ncbi:MAG: glycosyltransferase family 4 protein [Bryobacteraceae bacterium]
MKKSILIIVENESVPFDTRVWKEAQSLQRSGYEVSVLCPCRKGDKRGLEVLQGVYIYRHPTPLEANGALGYVVEYGSALVWEFLYSWRIYFSRGFHVLQGCNPPDTIWLVALPFKLLGVKYIFDHHDATPELYLSKYDKKGLLYQVQVWLESMTYKVADVVMATNRSYADLAISRGGHDPRNVFVVRNGPDLETFNPVPLVPELKHDKKFLVGYVGTMSIQEGLDILLDVALYIKQLGRTDIHFTCVGGGPGLAGLRQMVIDKDLSDIVDFTGRVSDQKLLEVLSAADVCVNPDKPCEMNDISTMIKIMEYMALSKPIVQFDLKEGRYSAGDASLYADPARMVPDFAEKILWLLDNPAERERMGAFGRRRVEQELSWGYSTKNLLAAYSRVLGAAPLDSHSDGSLGVRP